jgi:RHS repeat-associated protein
MKLKLVHTLITTVLLAAASAQAGGLGCGNWDKNLCPNCPDTAGTGTFSNSNGNETRIVDDFSVSGAVGEFGLKWTRNFASRENSSSIKFGGWSRWRHNYQWGMTDPGSSYGMDWRYVQYPDGDIVLFHTPVTAPEPRTWTPKYARYTDVIVSSSSTDYELRRQDGTRASFVKITDGSGSYYLCSKVSDRLGNDYLLSYNSNHDVSRVTEPAGRYFDIAYTTIPYTTYNTTSSETVITSVTGSDGRSISYRYNHLLDTYWGHEFITLAGVDYGDGTHANYAYQIDNAYLPNLIEANDVLKRGQDQWVKYSYNWTSSSSGIIGSVYNGKTGTLMATREYNSGKVDYANGRTVTDDFGTNNNINSKTDGLGGVTSFTYDASGGGFMLSETDPRGYTTSYTRDTQGRPLTISYPDGGFESFTYDSLGQVLTHSVKQSASVTVTTTYTRDPVTHLVTQIEYPDSSYETFAYNGYGQSLTHRQRNGGVETMTYDTRGLLTSKTDAESYTTTYAYYLGTEPGHSNDQDRLMNVTDARGNTTSFEYDWRGQVLTIINPDDMPAAPSRVHYTYDSYGNKLTTTNEVGNTWTYTYDEFKRLLASTDPLNRATSYSYALPGAGACGCAASKDKPTQITLPSGKVTKITYDVEWQKTSQTAGYGTPEAATTSFSYDAAGNLESTIDPNGKLWTFTFDANGRRKTSRDPLGNTTVWTYDAAGNQLTTTRPDNGVTTNVYDPMNRMISTTDPANQTTTYAYGGVAYGDGTFGDNLLRLTDARSNGYDFTYDLAGRKTSMIYPPAAGAGARCQEVWTYDAAGNIATYTTRAGQVKTCTYDSRNRETLCDWSDATPDVTKSYDNAGRMLTLNNSVASISYSYDQSNQLTSETETVDGQVRTVGYTYDVDGNRASVTYPGGTAITYDYTGRNQIKEISTDGPPPIASYSYDLNGNRQGKTLENGTSVSYTYDDANRLVALNNTLASGSTIPSVNYGYGLDSVGNRTSRTETVGAAPSGTDSYTYDAVDQISGVAYGSGRNVSYIYDPVGNRSNVTDSAVGVTNYTSNNLNQYTAVGSDVPTYDTNGNLTNCQGWSYTYDAQNRLVTANNVVAGKAAIFVYDGKNRCVKRTLNGVVTYLGYEDWNLIEERDSFGALTTHYIHGAAIDEIVARVDAGGVAYYHHDGLGSTVALTNSAGVLVERYEYDVYGAASIYTAAGVVVPTSAFNNRFLFTDREWLPEMAIYDYRNRMYSGDLGRFLQTDPMEFDARDVNLYRYVKNSVTNLVDPTGLIDCWTSPGGTVSPVTPNPGEIGQLPPLPPGRKVGAPGLIKAIVTVGGCESAHNSCNDCCATNYGDCPDKFERCQKRCDSLYKLCKQTGGKGTGKFKDFLLRKRL